jgi:hypothetical protein
LPETQTAAEAPGPAGETLAPTGAAGPEGSVSELSLAPAPGEAAALPGAAGPAPEGLPETQTTAEAPGPAAAAGPEGAALPEGAAAPAPVGTLETQAAAEAPGPVAAGPEVSTGEVAVRFLPYHLPCSIKRKDRDP